MKSPPDRGKRNARGQAGVIVETEQQRQSNRSTESPEFGTSRRRFLIAMFMCGAVKSDRVVETIVAELEGDE
jgi:hypothetical protein